MATLQQKIRDVVMEQGATEVALVLPADAALRLAVYVDRYGQLPTSELGSARIIGRIQTDNKQAKEQRDG